MRISLHSSAYLPKSFNHERLPSLKPCRREAAVAPMPTAGFTMMEIAISLAIIGIALVAIIGVLPYGMNVQQTNRQDTIVNQDAALLMEDIRNGALGADDLTNYIIGITNYWAEYKANGQPLIPPGPDTVNTYSFTSANVKQGYYTQLGSPLTNGANILGLLCTPEFTDTAGNPTNNIYAGDYYSNHIIATFYSISGPAVQKPPQDNPIMQQDSLAYRLYCVNVPTPINTNDIFNNNQSDYEYQLAAALHELRLTFYYPLLPNGKVGVGQPKTYRTQIAGQLVFQPVAGSPFSVHGNSTPYLYMYQPQSFINSP